MEDPVAGISKKHKDMCPCSLSRIFNTLRNPKHGQQVHKPTGCVPDYRGVTHVSWDRVRLTCDNTRNIIGKCTALRCALELKIQVHSTHMTS